MPLHDRILRWLSVLCILCGIVWGLKALLADLKALDVVMDCLISLIAMVGGLGVYTKVREGK